MKSTSKMTWNKNVAITRSPLSDVEEGKAWQNKTGITIQSHVEVVLLQVTLCRADLHLQHTNAIKIFISKFTGLINGFTAKP